MPVERYSRSAMLLHWAIALILAFQLALGWQLEEIPRGPGLFSAYQLHKSVGITILLLTLIRIAIRWWHPRPPAFADSPWAARLSKLVHAALYGVMLGVPITGWIIVSTSKTNIPTLIFGAIPWPHLPLGRGWHEPAEGIHGLLAISGALLIVLHIVGALRHQFVKDENILGRMIPLIGSATSIARSRAAIGAGIALAALASAFAMAGQLGFDDKVTVPVAGAVSTQAGAPTAPPLVEADALDPDADDAKLKAEEALKSEEKAKAEANAAKPNDVMANATPAAAPATTVAATIPTPQITPLVPLSDWTVQPGGRLGFTANWNGTAVPGRFDKWQAAIKFSPNDLPKSTIRVTIDLASVDTSDSQRDESIRGDSFFNIGAHPTAVFTSSDIRKTGGNGFEARGTLNLHGVAQPVALRFTLNFAGDTVRAQGSTAIDRTRFGVGSGEWSATDQIAGRVPINFAFTARRGS